MWKKLVYFIFVLFQEMSEDISDIIIKSKGHEGVEAQESRVTQNPPSPI